MWNTNGFFVSNNMWNDTVGPQTTYACSYSNWYTVSTETNSAGAVKTYPNVHKDFNAPVSSFNTITSSYAEVSPSSGIWNFAYDIWLNGTASAGSTEVMIWNDVKGQTPAGSKVTTVTLGGKTYDVWKTSNSSYIAFVLKSYDNSGTVNLLEMFNWITAQGWLSNPTLSQIDYGVEIVSTDGAPMTFKFTNFSLTTN